MDRNKIRIATRGSQLALIQSNMVKSWLEGRYPGIDVELVIIKTLGDKILDSPLSKVGGKGLFVKEIEESLLKKETDIAVHSMKDVPTDFPECLHIQSISSREIPMDAFISKSYPSLNHLPKNAIIGTSSLRRQVQLLHRFPEFQFKDIRGNVNTRLKKLEEEKLDGIILACAGLNRMALDQEITEVISSDICIPAVGQGAIGIESRIEDDYINTMIRDFNDPITYTCVMAERSFMKRLEGGCQVPIAGFSVITGDELKIVGMISSLDGKKYLFDEAIGRVDEYKELGITLAENLLRQGAGDILLEIRNIY